jgi:hypothetical protein
MQMDENKVRMKITMRLLLVGHNDYKEMLEYNVVELWNKAMAARTAAQSNK